MTFEFSESSLKRLQTCHEDLQKVMTIALAHSDIDFGIAEGHRTPKRQNELFNTRDKNGKRLTKIDGITQLSKHNHSPSLAVDIYAFVNGRTDYSLINMCYLAGVILSTAKRLHQIGRITHAVRWGGNWDRDNELLTDQDFDDTPHFELET